MDQLYKRLIQAGEVSWDPLTFKTGRIARLSVLFKVLTFNVLNKAVIYRLLIDPPNPMSPLLLAYIEYNIL